MRTILILMFFAQISSGQKTLNILIKMIPEQRDYFQKVILDGFEREYGYRVNVHTFSDNWELSEKLGNKHSQIDVVKVPMGMAHPLALNDLVTPLGNILQGDKLERLVSQYFLMNLAEVNGKVYYIPRKFETRIMAYRKSKVKEAVKNWKKYFSQIDGTLKAVIQKGLPANYELEREPSFWDYYDIFVAGFYWSREHSPKHPQGKIAHRGKEYSGTSIGLMDRCFQFGATESDILNLESPFLLEVLKWESLYTAAKVYHQDSWLKGWGGQDIWQAFSREDVYLSFLTQIDCYFLYGANSTSYVSNPQDLGFAIMPKAVTLNENTPKKRTISTGGWLWGVGKFSPKPAMALNLIEFITNYKNQIAECDRFGMIPVRKDILGRSSIKFKEDWKNEIFSISLKQLRFNGHTALPYIQEFNEVEKAYIALWKTIVIGSKNGYMGEHEIKAIE